MSFQELGLYYDGDSGTYYAYDYETQTYKIHSRVEVDSGDEGSESSGGEERKIEEEELENERDDIGVITYCIYLACFLSRIHNRGVL